MHSLTAHQSAVYSFPTCPNPADYSFLARPPILLFIFIHCLLTYSADFFPCLSAYSAVYSFLPCPPVQLFIPSLPSQWAVPTCSVVYSLLAYPMGSAHLFSCLFIPCLPSGQCPPVQLFIHSLPARVFSRLFIFLPAHLFSCLFFPSRPPIQLFINSLPAQLAPKSPSTVYITIYIAFWPIYPSSCASV
jgi:hypothetical protein